MQQPCAALIRASALLRSSRCLSGTRPFATTAASQAQQTHNYDPYSVPAGHQNSDLGSIACNISLNRRRDLTLREDLKVVADGKQATLAAVMRVCAQRPGRMPAAPMHAYRDRYVGHANPIQQAHSQSQAEDQQKPALQGKLVAMFGVPDMGKVCSEKHLPDFLKNASLLSLWHACFPNLEVNAFLISL